MNWEPIYTLLNEKGFAYLPGILSSDECTELVSGYTQPDRYRNVINMKRARFGQGEYKYFNYPLPESILKRRQELYEPLAVLANQWMNQLSLDIHYPVKHSEFIELCHQKNQLRPTPLILRYQAGGFNTLHQDLYGEVYFPFQIIVALTQRGVDYEGGELILTEQVPRAQSKAQVIRLDLGDAVIITTNFRPVKGIRGYYRASIKHGVSEVTSGERYALGIILHDGN